MLKFRDKLRVGAILTAIAIPILAIAGFAVYWYIDYVPYVRLKVDYPRVDCFPEGGRNKTKCLERGCVWAPTVFDQKSPWCIFPEKNYGYFQSEPTRETDFGLQFSLKRIKNPSLFSKDSEDLILDVDFQTTDRVRLKFYDPNNKRYEVPQTAVNITSSGIQPIRRKYLISWKNSTNGFSIQIIRQTSGITIVDSSVSGFTFSEQFLQIGLKLSSSAVYGLGEHTHREFKHNMDWIEWAIFARDAPVDGNYYNSYGHQPFFINIEKDGTALGVLLLNSNAMEIQLMSSPAVVYRTIGGILDFYIFLGSKVGDVIQQYLQAIGVPFIPPYWSLGFHLGRLGYDNISHLESIIERNWEAGIPYDVQHLNIDYMDKKRSFTYDSKNFKNLSCLIKKLHSRGQHFIMLLDAGISSDRDLENFYLPLKWGLQEDIFIKSSSGENIEGEARPGSVYYPDFTHPKIDDYWYQLANMIYNVKNLKFDGLWIHMNEPSNFIPGSRDGCQKNRLNEPPFIPSISDSKLYGKTICMDSVHYNGSLHYNVHSLYGHFMAIATFKMLLRLKPDRRPFILTRSNFVGTGHYAAHWSGDNFSSWQQLRWSIPFLLEMNLFGIPFVGADVCGFGGNVQEELCIRWMQVGAFYPFCRNNNDAESKDQDPAAFGEKFINITRSVLLTRYRLLPYLYTLFYSVRTEEGGMVVASLVQEFPEDQTTWNIDEQFLWGAALLISPALYEGQTTVKAYFPKTRWYDYYTGVEQKWKGFVHLNTPLENINLHIRGGYIIPVQEPMQTTTLSRQNPIELIVALDGNGKAHGTLFWDDGESNDVYENKRILLFDFKMREYSEYHLKRNELLSICNNPSNISVDLYFSAVHIYGVNLKPQFITLNSYRLAEKHIQHDNKGKVLQLTGLRFHVLGQMNISLIYEDRHKQQKIHNIASLENLI